ncbi:MAG: YggT family protein, partial [Cyanobacteria bacterium P01_C01_bin.69]
RILLTWFPQIDWSNPILSTLSQLTDPYLNLFRSIIPPIGGLDLSAILALIALRLLSGGIAGLGSAAAQAAYYSSLY